jgi:hypothetical protein
MATKPPKRKLFPEDLSVFTAKPAIKPESEDLPLRKPVKEKSSRRVTSIELEKALLLMKQLGFKVTVPTTEEDEEKQEASIEKLGIARKVVKAPVQTEQLRVILGTTHTVGDRSYGPGEVLLSPDQGDLLRSLIHQDYLARQANLESVVNNPYSRFYVISPGRGRDEFNKFTKREVSEGQFNNGFGDDIAVTAGKYDVAGYHENTSQNRQF